MVAGKRSLEIDPARLERLREDASSRNRFASLGMAHVPALRAHFSAGPEDLRSYVGPGPLLTDDRPLIECFLSSQAGTGSKSRRSTSGPIAAHPARP